jgi:hypothetical protein
MGSSVRLRPSQNDPGLVSPFIPSSYPIEFFRMAGMILAAKWRTTTRYTSDSRRWGGRVSAMSVTLSKIPLAAREKRPCTVVSGKERGLDGGKVAGDGSQPEPYVRGLRISGH